MEIRSVGIDLGKTSFHLVALGDNGKVLLKKKFSQKQLITFTANLQTSLIGMEACSGAHFLARALRAQGHDVKLIPAQFVKPFVKSNKNDFLDAEAIAEAVDRHNMRFVPIKTDDQLDLQALHRVRDRLMIRRTSLINQIRAFLLERGMVFAKSPIRLREAIPEVLENANENLTPRMRNLVAMLWNEWKGLELQIVEMNDEVERIASSDAACIRLRQIPGIGPAGRNSDRRFDRQRSGLPEGTRVCSLDGTGTEATFYRRQGEAVWDQQARQLLSAQDPGARGPGSGAAIETRPPRDGHMDNGTGDESTTQRVDRRHGQQAGADRVGGPFKRSELSGCSECHGSITGPHQALPPRSAMDK